MHRLKFYSLNDMSIGHNLNKLFDVINNFDNTKKDFKINDVIEFYNVTIFVDNNLFLEKWSDHEIQLIKDTCKQFRIIVNQFFSNISDFNLKRIFEEVDWNYKDNFWEMIEKQKTYSNFTEDKFISFIHLCSPNLRYILRNKRLVNHFDIAIKDYILSDPNNAEIILDNYEVFDKQYRLNIPKSFTIEDKEILIIDYIKSSNHNLNYLRLIAIVQNNKDMIVVSDKTRLLAIKKAQDIENKLFVKGSGYNIELSVKFMEQDDEVVANSKNHSFEYCYSNKWIEENKDFSTLLNNFIYLFNYVDLQMRISLTKKISEMCTIEKLIVLRSQKSYSPSIGFVNKNHMANLQMISYYNKLKEVNLTLEDIVKWFFQEYLFNEFNVQDYRIKIPSTDTKYYEKCRSILPEMESVLKQFNLFVEDGKIDHELLQISSEHLLFKNCKSLLEKKYIYPDSNEFQRITHYLFSDQCMLAYLERISKRYKNFFELIQNEIVSLDDYAEYNTHDLDWLLKKDFIKIVNNRITFSNITQILIFKDIYYNDVICYHRCPPEVKEEIDKLIAIGILKYESSLFSKPEQDYFNYHLNKSFNDSMDLRNRYIHGTQPNDDNDEKIHEMNYMVILKLFILMIIKINDEFCLATI